MKAEVEDGENGRQGDGAIKHAARLLISPSPRLPLSPSLSLWRPRDDFSVFGRWGRRGRRRTRGCGRLRLGRARVSARSGRARVVFGVRLVAILARRRGRSVARPCFVLVLRARRVVGRGHAVFREDGRLPRGVGEGAGGDERAGAEDCVSVVRAFRPAVAARELSSAFGSLRFSPVGADAASRVRASFLFFERDASSVAGTPFSERTVGSLGAFAWPGATGGT